MEKLPKIGIPVIIIAILLIIVIAKSAVTIGSGEAGVLYKTFDNGVVTDAPPLGEGFHGCTLEQSDHLRSTSARIV